MHDLDQLLTAVTSKSYSDNRTVDSICNGLLCSISHNPKISGRRDVGEGLIEITKRFTTDNAFNSNMKELAYTIMSVFPVEKTESVESDKPEEVTV